MDGKIRDGCPDEIRCDKLNALRSDSVNLSRQAVTNVLQLNKIYRVVSRAKNFTPME